MMLMFDTLSRGFLSNFGNEWIKTPNFERLRQKTITFENFYGGSMPCMPARRELHTGRYNFMHRMWGQLEPFDHSIFDVLQKNGVYCHLVTDHSHYFEDGGATYHNRYSTWEGFRGQEGDRWKLGKSSGETNPLNKKGVSFDQHLANRTKQVEEKDMSSVITIQAGLDFLEAYKDEDNWFLQIECFDPHEPFYVPEIYRELYNENLNENPYFWPKYGKVTDDISEEDLNELQQEYAALISMCDAHLGRVLDFLEENNMWDDTLIIVNTDHGFLLGEHDWLGKNLPPMYEEVIHLPFFMNIPNKSLEGNKCDVLSQTIDIPATLLDYFGIENNLDMDGKSLLPVLDGKETELHDCIIFGTYGGHVSIYDGRYVYMRASVHPDNGPNVIQTLNYNLMRGFLNKQQLDNMILKPGNRFTNQFPYTEIEVSTFIDSYSIGHLLFDLKNDPNQEHVLEDDQIENEMIQKLIKVMNKIEVPEAEYEWLGLKKYL
ncbi:sulfatase-like hydrolase/transferase [Amphibacillus sediminis]|uniref:sulfatase-like hydrolase/transferase n=1 Tax=Amphibacillus sediminis TaxID=360185 RepID=UPI001FDF71FF|nr:sulfatase-like hydrolase/transferase [Amphibacillus sediminis]